MKITLAKVIDGSIMVGLYNKEENKLIDAYIVGMIKTPTGVDIQFLPPFMPFSDEHIEVDGQFIISTLEIEGQPKFQELCDKYLQIKTGIVITADMPDENQPANDDKKIIDIGNLKN